MVGADIGAFESPGDPFVQVDAPSIDTQPQNQTASIAEDVVFNVGASGAFLQYQWKRGSTAVVDSTSVSGSQTATLTLRGAGMTSGGSYSVTIKNNAGLTNSAPATLVITNPYIALSGTYNGLFFENDQARPAHAGFFSIAVKTNGIFSGNNNIKGVNRALSGRFIDGVAHLVVATNPPITMDMTIDLAGSGVVSGAVNGTNWSAPLFGERGRSINSPAVRDAVSLSSVSDGRLAPGGDGFGVANIATNGKVSFTGTLSDACVQCH